MSNALFDGCVPDFPQDCGDWSVYLRWAIAVMDDDDTSMAFVASCLSHCIKYGGLTDRQHVACVKIVDRLRQRWFDGTLDAEQGSDDVFEDFETRGSC